jgi:Ca-activated chloride channel family protein
MNGHPLTANAPRRALLALVAVLLLAAPAALAQQVRLDVALSNGKVLADQKQTAYLRVAMTGFELAGTARRTPANVCIVLDRSGSMQGEKIVKAKEAALMVVDRLNPDDIISVVAYDSNVAVLVPATKAFDKEPIRAALRGVEANTSTALFAGVSVGAAELRKFLGRDRVNRIILLSDGQANVGPSAPGALGELGAALIREGISVTTIGLGLDYNEDLMTALAQKSDGNHMFAEKASDLTSAFESEFGSVAAVVAQEVRTNIRCADGVRPVRAIGREADIAGQNVTFYLNQLYSQQERYLVLEVELPPGTAGTSREVASVDVSYSNMASKAPDHLAGTTAVAYTASPQEVETSVNAAVMTAAVYQIGAEQNVLAMRLRDQGKVEEGVKVLKKNASWIVDNATKLNDDKLNSYGVSNSSTADSWTAKPGEAQQPYTEQRKQMREEQYSIQNNLKVLIKK